MERQPELAFDAPSAGFTRWREERSEALRRLVGELGLPLGHEVEVWLRGGVRLRGKLRLREDGLFVPEGAPGLPHLVVDGTPFTIGEIESCVRVD